MTATSATLDSIDSDLTADLALDKPLIVAAMRQMSTSAVATSGAWKQTGGGSDETSSDYPAKRGLDGRASGVTRPDASQSTWLYQVDLGELRAFDVVAILGHNFSSLSTGGTLEITVEVADNADFSTNLIEIAELHSDSSAPSDDTRMVALSLFHTGSDPRRYTARYVRLKITGVSAGIPELGEMVIGQRVQCPHFAMLPWDEDTLGHRRVDFEANNGDVTTYVFHKGRARSKLRFNPETSATHAKYEQIWSLSEYGTRNVLYIPKPNSEPTKAYLSKFEQGDLQKAYNGPLVRVFDFPTLTELPPFVSAEA